MAINMLVALDAKQKTHGHDGIPPCLGIRLFTKGINLIGHILSTFQIRFSRINHSYLLTRHFIENKMGELACNCKKLEKNKGKCHIS